MDDKSDSIKHEETLTKEIRKGIVYPIIATVISSVILAVLGLSSVSQINTSLKDINNSIIDSSNHQDKSVQNQGDNNTVINNNNITYNVIEPTSGMMQFETTEDEIHSLKLNYAGQEIFGRIVSTNEIVTIEDIESKPIICTYMEDGKEIYFKGQINSKYHWEGQCTINAYIGDNLADSMEAVYSDGNCLEYRQLHKEDNLWWYSEKLGDANKKVIEKYSYEKDYVKNFDKESVKDSDIVSPQDAVNYRAGNIKEYYSGSTQKGKYSDDSGNAFLIKYGDDGKINRFFCCKFKDGQPNDNSENGYSIVWDDTTKGYLYYKGRFKNGSRVGKDINEKKLSIERIEKLLTVEFTSNDWRV